LKRAAALRVYQVAVDAAHRAADPLGVRVLDDHPPAMLVGSDGIGGLLVDVDQHAVNHGGAGGHANRDHGLLRVVVDEMAAHDPDIFCAGDRQRL
jgi:hypothetical protein